MAAGISPVAGKARTGNRGMCLQVSYRLPWQPALPTPVGVLFERSVDRYNELERLHENAFTFQMPAHRR